MVDEQHGIIIVGGGQAAIEAAFSLRAQGCTARIRVLAEQDALPYQLPPLSKGFLLGTAAPESMHLRTEKAYQDQKIELLRGARAVSLDTAGKAITLSDGTALRYQTLILATGGRARTFPAAFGPLHEAVNFSYLRTLADATRIAGQLVAGSHLAIIGGGYIGLEIAAAARAKGVRVTLVTDTERILERVAAAPTAELVRAVHEQQGVRILTSARVRDISLATDGQRVTAIDCEDGSHIEADHFIAGIGLVPNDGLAAEAGLRVDDGVLIDEHMRTSDASVYAIGDCARFEHPRYGRALRIESVPNAIEQARRVAAVLCEKPVRPYGLPWFWSDQYDMALKIAGLPFDYDQVVVRGEPDPAAPSLAVFYLRDSVAVTVETINRVAEFGAARQLITLEVPVAAAHLADDSIPLKELLQAARASAET